MPRTRISGSFSDNFWQDFPKYITNSNIVYSAKRKEDKNLNNFLSAIDESPEFYDPYSELNMFLSKKIRENNLDSVWSLKFQEELLKKISPEFQERFPGYRLGATAVKRAWDKVAYYWNHMKQHPQALDEDSKLNIAFFIRENLKNSTYHSTSSLMHPSYHAQQIASKLGECLAVIDGTRANLPYLTRLIWGMQRHLICCHQAEALRSPYDSYDHSDRRIVHAIIQALSRETPLSQQELQQEVSEEIEAREEKIYAWSVQGDLLFRFIQLDADASIVDRISALFSIKKQLPHAQFVAEVAKHFPEKEKHLLWMSYKWCWYTLFSSPGESSFDRFIAWHKHEFTLQGMDKEECGKRIREIVSQMLPLAPSN